MVIRCGRPFCQGMVQSCLTRSRWQPWERGGFASYREIQDWLWQHHGMRLACSTVHTLVRYKLKARPRVARRSTRKKGPRRLSKLQG